MIYGRKIRMIIIFVPSGTKYLIMYRNVPKHYGQYDMFCMFKHTKLLQSRVYNFAYKNDNAFAMMNAHSTKLGINSGIVENIDTFYVAYLL